MKSLIEFINESSVNEAKELPEISYPFQVDWEPNEDGCKAIEKWLKDEGLMPKERPSWIKSSCQKVKWEVYIWTDDDKNHHYAFGYTYEIKKKIKETYRVGGVPYTNTKTQTTKGMSSLLMFYSTCITRDNKGVAIESDDKYFNDKMSIIQPIIDKLNVKFDSKNIQYLPK